MDVLIFLDLETAGTNPARHPRIQIAAMAVDESLDEIRASEPKNLFDEKRDDRRSLRKSHLHPRNWAKEALAPEVGAREFAVFLRCNEFVKLTSSVVGYCKPYREARIVAHIAAFPDARNPAGIETQIAPGQHKGNRPILLQRFSPTSNHVGQMKLSKVDRANPTILAFGSGNFGELRITLHVGI